MNRPTHHSHALVLPLVALLLSPCAVSRAAAPVSPTAPPATDAPPLSTSTHTPIPPTATPTAIPSTATPSPTPDIAATAAAEATATAAPLIAMIDAELQEYGLSTEQGHLGWMHDPVTIELDSYGQDDIQTDYPDVTASDFVVQADITWTTTTGVAGCGLAVRADPDFDHGDSYRLYMARFGPLWDIEYYEAGKFYSNLTGLRDALPLDDGLSSTNRVTVVAQGNRLDAYANGQELDTVADIRLTQGTVAFIGWQESGNTTCTFENAWLWVLKD